MLSHDAINGGVAGVYVAYLAGVMSKKKKGEEDSKDEEKCAEVGAWFLGSFPEVAPQLSALFGHTTAYEIIFVGASKQRNDLVWLDT